MVRSVIYVKALFEALDLQVDVARDLQPSQLSLASPCEGWSVHDVLNHSIGVTMKFSDFAAGGTDHPHAPDGDLVGPDHGVTLRNAADRARGAWGSADMNRSCCLPFGTFSADLAAGINLFDLLAHTWDIAAAVSRPVDCPDQLWEVALRAAVAVIGPNRDLGQYGPIVALGTTSSRLRFLGFLGRDPLI